MFNRSPSPYANSRKRLSEQDHYDPLQRVTRRNWTVSRAVDPSVLLDFAQAYRMSTPQRATIQNRRHGHDSGIWIDTDPQKTNMHRTTSQASSGRISRISSPGVEYSTHHPTSRSGISEAREIQGHQATNGGDSSHAPDIATMKSPGLSARSPSPLSPDYNPSSSSYVATSPQFCPDPQRHEPSPTSPAHIPSSPKWIPRPAAYAPDSPKIDPGSPKISAVSPRPGRSPGWSDYRPWQTPHPDSPGLSLDFGYEADWPENSLQHIATPVAPGYRPYLPYDHDEAGMHAVDPPSSRQQTPIEDEELTTRSAREENVPPETPGSSPNNPIVLSPILGFSDGATLFRSNGHTNGAMRSERLARSTSGSSSPSQHTTFTRTPEVQELSSYVDPGITSEEDDGTEDQSLMHEDQPSTLEVGTTATLKAEVDKAISLLNKLGVPRLGRAVCNVYAWSKDDPEVAEVMTRVLLGTPTVEQETVFQAMIEHIPTPFMDADGRMASPSLAEDFESDHEETRGSLVGEGESVYSIGEGTSVYSIGEGETIFLGDMEEDEDEDDASTASFPSVPSSPSTVKGDEVRDHLSAETVWGAIVGHYMLEGQED